MKTDVVKPQGVFYNPTRLIVPLFQRPYVWSKETQWEPLWTDIIRLIDVISNHNPNATHFLGAIVIQQVPTKLGGIASWNVIDGQQRLTTLQLLLDALHDELGSRGMNTLAGRIRPLIENPEDNCEKPEDRYKLWPTNRDRDSFVAAMSANSPSTDRSHAGSRMVTCHSFFAEAITDWLGTGDGVDSRARTLVGAITERLEIASISLDAQEDAQAIFETLNARGTPLSAADLIKNYVFQLVPDSEAERAYTQYWSEFETPWWEREVTVGRAKYTRSSLFMSQWLTARTIEDFAVREVFARFKHYVSTVAKDVGLLLVDLQRAAARYRTIIEGSERVHGELSRVELFAYRVSALDSELARPLLIWLDEPEQADVPVGDKNRILEILESWFVRRALVKAPTKGINRFLIDLLQRMSRQSHEDIVAATESFLSGYRSDTGYWPDDNEIRTALTGETVYWRFLKGRLRMVLEAIEDRKRGYPDGKPLAMGPIVRKKATIEHIMPQKWRRNWYVDLDEEAGLARDRAIQTLGNLTLVTQSLNSRVSNGSWATKRAHFLDSDDVLITKDAIKLSSEAGDWDESQIKTRTEQMIEEILKIWPVPRGHLARGDSRHQAAPAVAVDLARLVAEGWVAPSTDLTSAMESHRHVQASVSQDGRVFVGEVPFDTPSSAAKSVTGWTSANGWTFWAMGDSSKTLADVRGEYLASLGEAEADVIGDEAEATEQVFVDVDLPDDE